MIISKTIWLDYDSKEAVVTIQGKHLSIDCYVYGFVINTQDLSECFLSAVDTKDVVLATGEQEAIVMDGLTCAIVGRLCNNRSIVRVDDFSIAINPSVIPNDIYDGQTIALRVLRVNIYRSYQ